MYKTNNRITTDAVKDTLDYIIEKYNIKDCYISNNELISIITKLKNTRFADVMSHVVKERIIYKGKLFINLLFGTGLQKDEILLYTSLKKYIRILILTNDERNIKDIIE